MSLDIHCYLQKVSRYCKHVCLAWNTSISMMAQEEGSLVVPLVTLGNNQARERRSFLFSFFLLHTHKRRYPLPSLGAEKMHEKNALAFLAAGLLFQFQQYRLQNERRAKIGRQWTDLLHKSAEKAFLPF